MKISNKNPNTDDLIKFIVWTFGFSWLMWLPGILCTYNLIGKDSIVINSISYLNFAGGIGPSLIAFFLTFKKEGIKGCKILFNRLLRIRLSYWYFHIFLLLPFLLILAHILNYLLWGTDFPQTDLIRKPYLIPALFILFFIMQFSEEFGWRGYALNRLQNIRNVLSSSILLGTVWTVWHIPMFFSEGFPHFQYHFPFTQLFITLVTASIIITWLQNNCNGSLIPAFVIHSLINLSGEVMPLIEKSKAVQGNYRPWIILNVLLIIASIFIAIHWRKTGHLKKI